MHDITQRFVNGAAKRGLALILTQDQARKTKTELIASLLLNGPLFVVSGDEWLPSFLLPQILRRHTPFVKEILDRLYTVRASTCYRLYDSLANIPSHGEPLLVLDFLHTFYDRDIPLRTRLFRLRECCRELNRLAFYRSVLVITREQGGEEYEKFIPALFSITDLRSTLAPELETITQSPLF